MIFSISLYTFLFLLFSHIPLFSKARYPSETYLDDIGRTFFIFSNKEKRKNIFKKKLFLKNGKRYDKAEFSGIHTIILTKADNQYLVELFSKAWHVISRSGFGTMENGNFYVLQPFNSMIQKRVYDSFGNLVEESYLDNYLKPAPIKIGKIQYAYNKAGNLLSISHYSPEGTAIPDEYGVHLYAYKYDEYGNQIRESKYDSKGHLKPDSQKKTIIENRYDKFGNMILEAYYDKDRKLISGTGSIAIYRFYYDRKGNLTKGKYYNKHKKLTNNYEGIAYYTYKYNSQGLVSSVEYRNKKGQEVKNSEKVFRYEYTYDSLGNILQERRYHTEGVLLRSPYAIINYTHHGKLISSKEFLDDIGNPVEAGIAYANIVLDKEDNFLIQDSISPTSHILCYGYAKKEIFYDEKNRVSLVRFLNKEGSLVENGIAVLKYDYDLSNHLILAEYFDFRGQHKSLPGSHSVRYIYDKNGNLNSSTYFPPIQKQAYRLYRIEHIYNQNKKEVETRFYSSPEQLLQNRISIIQRKYNERNQIVQLRYLDSKYKEKTDKYGLIGLNYSYDPNNKLSSEILLGPGESSIYKKLYSYDENNRLKSKVILKNESIIDRKEYIYINFKNNRMLKITLNTLGEVHSSIMIPEPEE
ncbi:MAG: hypothetical protein H7A25_22540 [Leptospiraceae bacterium]|nr:hypothetical protein [Leptospiraceae bacterium]